MIIINTVIMKSTLAILFKALEILFFLPMMEVTPVLIAREKGKVISLALTEIELIKISVLL